MKDARLGLGSHRLLSTICVRRTSDDEILSHSLVPLLPLRTKLWPQANGEECPALFPASLARRLRALKFPED